MLQLQGHFRVITSGLKTSGSVNGTAISILKSVSNMTIPLTDPEDEDDNVRKAGNQILHLESASEKTGDLARNVLGKTRTIIGLVHARSAEAAGG